MGTLAKLLLLAIFCSIGFWLYQQASIESAKGNEASGDVMVIYWGGLIICSIGIAVLAAFTFLPKIGELLAGLFYSAPSQQIEKGPHTEALAKLAAGDYPGAIAAYEKAAQKDPDDVHALIEISRIYVDRLGDPAAAATRLEAALERDWPKDKVGPLMFRLADVYWKGLEDGDRARIILEQMLELLPDTTHAANAGARLREIEQAERESQEAAFLAGSTNANASTVGTNPEMQQEPSPAELGEELDTAPAPPETEAGVETTTADPDQPQRPA